MGLEEENRIVNTEGQPASEAPREVTLRYVAPAPREVTLRYVAPAPPASEAPEAAAVPAVPADAGMHGRRARHTGLRIFLICFGVLLVAALSLWGLYAGGVFSRRTPSPALRDSQRRADFNVSGGEETTIARYPNGDGTRLRYSETHGSSLTIQDIYTRVNPCTVTVATALPGGGAIIGTGVIFTENGYILTNAHVITGGQHCYVVLDNGRSYDNVKLVGYDAEKDLAVIKIDAHLLPTAEFGDSDTLTVGDPVYAIGNPLGVELRGTLTDGIVSAINRDVLVDGVSMTLIQTNAALNNGNSGGPLINVYGQVVGINTMKMGSSNAISVEGLGFAIPISSAAWMVDDLIAYGEIRGEPVLGLSVQRRSVTLPTGETALAVLELVPGGPAEKAGVELGDCIVRADGDPVETVNDLLRARRRFCAGEAITLELDRAGKRLTLDVVLEEAKD